MFVIVALLWASLALGVGPAPPPAPPPAEPAQPLTFPYFRVPEKVALCGEPVPLDDPAVREDLDREFTIAVWSRAQTTMWLKRAQRYFPEIQRKIMAQRLPPDLKYVAVAESDFRPKARSSAGAKGIWQFIPPTAQRFQLKANDAIDERMEFSAATDAALRYLSQLHRLLNNWTLALAAYNCGEGRVQKEMAAQGVRDYYHLALPEETERYVHRIIAAKVLLENPGRYGFDIPQDQLYPPIDSDAVDFTIAKEVRVKILADACGTYYKTIKRLNPWINGATLPPGAYRLQVPKGTGPRFKEAYLRGQIS
ncbi:MAG: lytic transglycosylase domain-containing protein [Thermodesulfobacteriota bacterium]